MNHDESPSHRSLEQRLLFLLQSVRDTHDSSARTELNTLLRENINARSVMAHLMVDEQALISRLRDDGIASLLEPAPAAVELPTRKAMRWLAWRPLAAAAAGIVLGIFCTSVVFAYVAPLLGKVVTLLDDSFESGSAPLVTGVPVEPGRWSGDYSEVVGEEQGVKPESGKKMLRLLQGDYEGKTNTKGSHVADIYRLIDMRPHRHEFADGSAVVQLSAGFNAFEFPHGETYTGKMTIHAFDAETATNGSLRAASAWDESCLAAASTGPTRLDRNPATWQRMTIDLRVSANTDFLLIHLMIPAGPGTHTQAGFGGHYIDDVRLTLRHSPLR